MIGLLRGNVHSISGQLVTIDVQGVGYEVWCSAGCLEIMQCGQEAQIVIYTDVREDSIRLFGFRNQLEKQVFLLLTQVKGIGPRTGAEIISHVDTRELLRIISGGDVAGLQAVRGVGKKTAERIILELKDKVASLIVERHISSLAVQKEVVAPIEEALQALQALGFTRRDAERALQAAAAANSYGADASSSMIVKEALRFV